MLELLAVVNYNFRDATGILLLLSHSAASTSESDTCEEPPYAQVTNSDLPEVQADRVSPGVPSKLGDRAPLPVARLPFGDPAGTGQGR